MQGDATIQLSGNLADDPEISFGGKTPVAKFRVLTNPRRFDRDRDQWVDGEPTGWKVVVFGKAAENVQESCRKGTRVTVIGTVAQRSYEAQDGEKKWVTEVTAEDVSVSLKWDTVKVQRMARASRGEAPTGADDPWATATPAGQR